MQTDVLTAQLASVAARFPPSPKHALHLISWLRMLEKKGGYGSVQREISSLTPVDQPAALLPLQLMKYLLCAAPTAFCWLAGLLTSQRAEPLLGSSTVGLGRGLLNVEKRKSIVGERSFRWEVELFCGRLPV